MMTRPNRLLTLAALCVTSLMMGCATTGAQQVDTPQPDAAPSAVDGKPTATDFDVNAVLGILQASAAAWSAGDLDAFVSVYAEDCLFMTSSGLTKGRAAVLARYRQRYPDRQAMGTLELQVLETRSAPPDGLAVAARWILAYPDRPAASGHTLVIFRRIGGTWQIVQDASM